MDVISVKDKKFKLFLSEEQILKEVSRVASEIDRDFEGKDPLFLSILNGSFMFASDLMKRVSIPSKISFVKMSSYEGVCSSGVVNEVIGLTESIRNKHVIIVEDIVETGLTMKRSLEILQKQEPASISICSLLCKPGRLQVDLDIKYTAFNIPDDFIVGYGLDYDDYGRNNRDLYSILK